MARKLERNDAYMFYVQDMKEIPEISELLKVPEKTLYRWKQEDVHAGKDWDKDREAFRATPTANANKMLQTSVARLGKLLDEIQAGNKLDAQEVYALKALYEMAERLTKGQHMYPYILAFTKEFTEFMDAEDPELLQQIIPHLSRFGEEMNKKYRKR